MKEIRLAVIPGDGIGKETVAAGKNVLDTVADVHGGFRFRYEQFDWSCEYYAKHGRMMPENGLDLLRPHDAIFLGAVGYPGVPDHISLWGLLIPIRRTFQQYINLRPVKPLPGVRTPRNVSTTLRHSQSEFNVRLTLDGGPNRPPGWLFPGPRGIPHKGKWCFFWGSRVAGGGTGIMKTFCLSSFVPVIRVGTLNAVHTLKNFKFPYGGEKNEETVFDVPGVCVRAFDGRCRVRGR